MVLRLSRKSSHGQGQPIWKSPRSLGHVGVKIFAVSLSGLAILVAICWASPAVAQQRQTSYQLAERPTPPPAQPRMVLTQRQPNEHPLMPALRWAQNGRKDLEQLTDYSATMVKRERLNGKLGEYEHMFIKVRHHPFSVYMRFLGPNNLKGQEAIYVKGANDGKMSAHGTGVRRFIGTLQLEPTGMLAMSGNRYPITELGVLNLVNRLVEIGERDTQYGECEVKFYPGAKIEERVCTCIEVMHPVPRRNFLFHVARIYIDDELNIPIRYEAYDWPENNGGKLVAMEENLTEEYTYLNLKLNNGYTNADFDIRNPNYKFGGK
jgi:hypothetical protein